jgi:hypothetical protein
MTAKNRQRPERAMAREKADFLLEWQKEGKWRSGWGEWRLAGI